MRPTLEFVGSGRHRLEGIEASVDVLEPLPVGMCGRVAPRTPVPLRPAPKEPVSRQRDATLVVDANIGCRKVSGVEAAMDGGLPSNRAERKGALRSATPSWFMRVVWSLM